MKIPMEDWLRGCVYHDGRHGEVTLPTDKVLEIADYIQLIRTRLADGMIELPPYEPQTEVKIEPSWVGETYGHFKDEPQRNILTAEQLATECEVESPCEVCSYRLSGHCNGCTHMKYDGRWCCECVNCHYEPKEEPQTERESE